MFSAITNDTDIDNCTFLSHCNSDILSDTAITCNFVWDVADPVQKYTFYVAAVEAVFFLVAFVWNVLIVTSFVRQKKLLKNPACIYLLNVAFTDLMFSVFVIFQCLLSQSAKHFIFGQTDVLRCGLCECLGFIAMVLVLNTLHMLAVLSLDRFFFLAKPLTYSKKYSWKTALLIVAAAWVLSCGLAVPPLFGLGSFSFNTVISNCHPQWSGMSKAGVSNIRYIMFIAAEVTFPIGALLLSNVWIVKVILASINQRYKRHQAGVAVDHRVREDQSSHHQVREEKKRHSEGQQQVLKIFGLFFVAHVCCWLPVLTSVVVAALIGASSIREEVFIVFWLLFLANPVIHPIIETYFIKDLRNTLLNCKKKPWSVE